MLLETILVGVMRIVDGDTLAAKTRRNVTLTVRVAGIDAPELDQPFGREARFALRELCLSRDATLTVYGRDRYRRTLARVRCQGRDAGETLVRAGLAWRYGREMAAMAALEVRARKAGRGLWCCRPVAPWRWRRGERR